MKHKFLFTFLLSCLIFSGFLAGCSKKDNPVSPANNEDSCGSNHVFDYYFSRFIVEEDFPYSYLDGGNRTFILDADIDSICTDLHISGEFKATMDLAGGVFSFRSAIKWNILWQASEVGVMDFTTSQVNWMASITNVGLKQGFGEDAASVSANIYITFPTRGSDLLDSAFFMDNFDNARIKIFYSYHKPPSGSSMINTNSYKDLIFAHQPNRNIFREVIMLPYSPNKTVIINKNYLM